MTVEQLLKSKGYSDQEIADLAPSLANPRFRATLEAELGDVDTLRANNTKLTADLDNYDKWFTTEITPEHEALRKRAYDAELNAAAADARFKKMNELAMQRAGAIQDPAAIAEADAAAKKAREAAEQAAGGGRKFVDEETFTQAFDKTGEAIAMAADLIEDHRELFGQRLNMTQMRLEAKAARIPVKQYVEQKFNYTAKRQEVEQKRQDAIVNAAVVKREQELMVQFGSNPNLRTLAPSASPFVARAKAANAKQPWERTESELTNDRIQRAYQKAVESGGAARA